MLNKKNIVATINWYFCITMALLKIRQLKKVCKNYHLKQFLFCSAYFSLLLLDDFIDGDFDKMILIRTFMLLVFGFFFLEFNLRVMVPLFLKVNKKLLYFLILAISLLTYSLLLLLLAKGLFGSHAFHDRLLGVYSYIVVQLAVVIVISMFFHYSYEYNLANKRIYQLQAIQKEQKEAELLALKSQINPHFLFNTLNNIYSYSFTNKPNTSELILKLSELTSYVLYDSDKETVPLSSEIDFISNYIELERIRLDDKVQVDFEIFECDRDIQVAPLLFIPLVENIFNHGLHNQSVNDYAHISLSIRNKKLTFVTENTHAESLDDNQKQGGIGLKNLRKRLELIYPGSELILTNEGGVFKTVMKFDIE